jgi:hypothetical protein
MAASKQPGKGGRARARSSSATAPPAKPTRKSSPKSARKATPRAARKPAKSAGKAQATTESNGKGKTAAAAKAEANGSSLRPPRRGGFARWFSVSALLTGVVLVIIVIASGARENGNNATVADAIPTINTAPAAPAVESPPDTTPTITAPPVTAPSVKTPPAAAPAAPQVAHRTVKCDPIVGSGSLNGGKTYPVTSSASGGRLTSCGEAHSVLLSALSTGGTTVSGWNCKTDTSGDPIAVCRSGTRTILARG